MTVAEGDPRIGVFHCHNSADKDAALEVVSALEPFARFHQFIDIDSIPAGSQFWPVIESKIASSDFILVYLGARGFGPSHRREFRLALQQPKSKVIPIWLDGIDRDAGRFAAAVDGETWSTGEPLTQVHGISMPQRSPGDAAFGQLFEILTGQKPPEGGVQKRMTYYTLRRDAQRWRRGAAERVFYRGQELREANAIAVREGLTESDAPLIRDFLSACRVRIRRFWGGVSAVLAVAAGIVIYAVADSRAKQAQYDDFNVRVMRPQDFSPDQQAQVVNACGDLGRETNSPFKGVVNVKIGARSVSFGVDEAEKKCGELGLTEADARSDVLLGRDFGFRDLGAKISYVLARMQGLPPLEAYVVAQSHNPKGQCSAIKIGRRAFNQLICSMAPTGGGFHQHMP